jgi:hypothetical protein
LQAAIPPALDQSSDRQARLEVRGADQAAALTWWLVAQRIVERGHA